MARVIHYLAHPAQHASRANAAIWAATQRVAGITRVDIYRENPRYDINVDLEQGRLVAHDVIVLQFPLFWYSAPALLKEWIDLTLEHGFAYGKDGTALKGKVLQLAITAGGPEDAYRPGGYQNADLRSFLLPFQQTAALCQMRFPAPFVLYGSLLGDPTDHAESAVALLEAWRDDTLDLARAEAADIMTAHSLPLTQKAKSHD